MRILVIADYLPYPLIGGDRIRIYNTLRRAAEKHEISLVAFLEKPSDIEGVAHLKEFCVHVETADFEQRSRFAKLPGMISYALSGKPPELSLLYSDELTQKIRKLTDPIRNLLILFRFGKITQSQIERIVVCTFTVDEF